MGLSKLFKKTFHPNRTKREEEEKKQMLEAQKHRESNLLEEIARLKEGKKSLEGADLIKLQESLDELGKQLLQIEKEVEESVRIGKRVEVKIDATGERFIVKAVDYDESYDQILSEELEVTGACSN